MHKWIPFLCSITSWNKVCKFSLGSLIQACLGSLKWVNLWMTLHKFTLFLLTTAWNESWTRYAYFHINRACEQIYSSLFFGAWVMKLCLNTIILFNITVKNHVFQKLEFKVRGATVLGNIWPCIYSSWLNIKRQRPKNKHHLPI